MHKDKLLTAAIVARSNIDSELRTLIIWGVAADEQEFETELRHKLQEKAPELTVINVVIAEPPDWIRGHYTASEARNHFPVSSPEYGRMN